MLLSPPGVPERPIGTDCKSVGFIPTEVRILPPGLVLQSSKLHQGERTVRTSSDIIVVMIIILNGSINSGKTTIAKILWNKIPNTAFIEIDKLREFVDWMPGEKAFPLSIENAVLIMKNFVKKELNVIFTYPLSEKNYEFIMDELKNVNTKIHIFTFSPDLKKTLTNRGTRELTEWEIKRIKYHYDIGINKPSFGKIINNTNQTPEETANEVLTYIAKS